MKFKLQLIANVLNLQISCVLMLACHRGCLKKKQETFSASLVGVRCVQQKQIFLMIFFWSFIFWYIKGRPSLADRMQYLFPTFQIRKDDEKTMSLKAMGKTSKVPTIMSLLTELILTLLGNKVFRLFLRWRLWWSAGLHKNNFALLIVMRVAQSAFCKALNCPLECLILVVSCVQQICEDTKFKLA